MAEKMKTAHRVDGGGLRKCVLANNSEGTFSALDLQVSRITRRFAFSLPMAAAVASLAYGEARQ